MSRSLSFSELTSYFLQLEETRSRNEMTDILVDLFKETPNSEVDIVCYLVLGQINAEYEEEVLGLGNKMVAKAISIASSKSKQEVQELFRETGDLGTVAEKISGETKTLNSFFGEQKELTVTEVHQGLKDISRFEGSGSYDKKLRTLAGLITRADKVGARYIVRISLGKLRLGIGAMTLLDTLAKTYTGDKKNRPEVERAYNISSDVGLVGKKLAYKGHKGLEDIEVEVGRPIRMMLAQRLENLDEVKDKLEDRFAAEVKYDGERMQIHKKNDEVKIYSRRMEDITHQYPDVVKAINQSIGSKEVIVEGEAVAYKDGELQDFQTLMQRKRKYDIQKYVEKIPVKIFLFDMLYKEDSLLDKPFPERRKKLEQTISENEIVKCSDIIKTTELREVEKFFNKSVDEGQEGIMIKSCSKDSIYRAGAREWLWIKWKKDYETRMSDTVDLTVVGGFAGRGRRSGLYGALLCAAYNKQKDIFETVCKLGTGFSDETLEELPEKLKPFESEKKPARVSSKIEPDQWFKPEFVVEVLGAELTKSPVHTAGIDTIGNEGIAIRFPRFIGFRADKKSEDSTTTKEIMVMYEKN
ncbi:ATP-dependent DNA ligase CDC9 [Methanonatronarchaeum thermophilum]|uniref:DNA ligase n=1 Tax=Methanonatronarchaeum thermophilum TaxID=1927129 RepID=A0A1Y3G9F6_9EURY|nr:ATP-dependent DNA ligase [Methanonatronarchaeum thermophilum]OUJ18072.1 ATP-dependent DNA ligase CDC9 [Methanonatronarchaeum thermophilum]